MTGLIHGVAWLALAVWAGLLFARGGFWRVRPGVPRYRLPTAPARIAIVIPARDEAASVGQTIRSLARQDYAGPLHIFLVDDHSSDGTGDIARAAAGSDRLTVIESAAIPEGWTGKLWAVFQGIEAAGAWHPEYVLLTDADIVHAPANLSRLTALADARGYSLVSLMVKLHCRTFAEKLLIPSFVFFFFMLYPPAWTSDPHKRTAGAAGGCMLIRREALERAGGIAAIRGELIDDCALARAIKRSRGRVWLAPSDDTFSVREYAGLGEIGRMISRTAFTQLNHSVWMLAGTVAAMMVTYVVPVLLVGTVPGALAWLAMMVAYLPTLRYYGRSPLWAPLLPGIALFYTGATVHSAVQYWLGRGGAWKGRVHAAKGGDASH